MSGRSGSEVRNRAKQVAVRLTDAEYGRLTREAESIGVSPGALLRWRFFGSPDSSSAKPRRHASDAG